MPPFQVVNPDTAFVRGTLPKELQKIFLVKQGASGILDLRLDLNRSSGSSSRGFLVGLGVFCPALLRFKHAACHALVRENA